MLSVKKMNRDLLDAEVFWQEFDKVKDVLMDIDSLSNKEADKVLHDLDKKLKRYSKGLDFILGDLTKKGRTFTITANGDEEYFTFVEGLMEYAPEINLWKIQGYLPPEGNHQVMKYNGYTLRSWEMFFVPLVKEEDATKVGLRIGVKKYIAKDDFNICAYLLIEKMIGEYNATTLIEYFDVVALPDDYEQQHYIPLDNLPDYIAWVLKGLRVLANRQKKEK